MSHEIESTDSFGEDRTKGLRAWHGLGSALPPNLSTVEAFKDIGLDWTTSLRPLWANADPRAEDSSPIAIPSHRAHIRTDNGRLLGIVSKSYKPLQNLQLASFVDSLVSADKNVHVETAGSLRHGKLIFALVRLPHDTPVVNDDILQNYLLVRNAHDGTGAIQLYPTSVRVVCANTIRMSEIDAGKGIRFNHFGDLSSKLETARYALGIATTWTDEFSAKIRLLASKVIGKEEARDYFRSTYDKTFGLLPATDSLTFERQLATRDKILNRWHENYENDWRQNISGIEQTAWSAYNAVSQYHDHERGRLKHLSDGRVHSNLFGSSQQSKTVALTEALNLTS